MDKFLDTSPTKTEPKDILKNIKQIDHKEWDWENDIKHQLNSLPIVTEPGEIWT
jgi:hypothetical protein